MPTLTCSLAFLIVGTATAVRTPTGGERRALLQAAYGYTSRLPSKDECSLRHLRVSTVDPRWAAADLSCKLLDPATMVFHRASTWRVAEVDGDYYVGCGLVPWKVVRDLGLLTTWPNDGGAHPGQMEANCKRERAKTRKAKERERKFHEQEEAGARKEAKEIAEKSQVWREECIAAKGKLIEVPTVPGFVPESREEEEAEQRAPGESSAVLCVTKPLYSSEPNNIEREPQW